MRMLPTWLVPSTSSVATTAALTSVLCKVMPCGRAKACTRVAVRSMRSRASVIICTYSVRCGIVLHPLAHAPQAVLHAVQRIGDLVGDAGHELADAQHLFLLADLGVGAVHVAADRGGEIDRDPQGAGEGHEHAQQVQRRPAAAAAADRRESAWETGDPAQVFQQHHRAHQRRHHGGEEIRRRPAQVHARDDHVEEEVEQERIARQVGEIQQAASGPPGRRRPGGRFADRRSPRRPPVLLAGGGKPGCSRAWRRRRRTAAAGWR